MGLNYIHLTLEERRKIERWRQANVSPAKMAQVLGRHRSTIFRELRRSHFSDAQMPDVAGYFAVVAQDETARRRSRKRKLIKHEDLRHLVAERIKAGWTPEQIAGRMRYEGAARRVCQEPSTALSIQRKVSLRSCGGICQRTARSADPDGPGNGALPSSIVT